MFIEHIILPLQDHTAVVNASQVLTNLLDQIEKRPLRATERRMIQKELTEFVQAHAIKQEERSLQQLYQRMQFDYLPGISFVGSTKPNEGGFEAHNNISPAAEASSEATANLSMDDVATIDSCDITQSPFSLNIPGKCFVCTVHRARSALWTTYRLFVDGHKESCDVSSPVIKYTKQILVLSARKLKQMSNQFQMWRSPDSKSWKDKNVDATLTKSSSQCYIGRCAMTREDKAGSAIAISVLSKSIDKLIHITALMALGPSEQQGLDALVADCEDSVLLDALQKAVNKVRPSVTTNGEGMDLSHATVLRSKAPKANSQSLGSRGKEMHALAFSHDCRVKAPSRKNMVIEMSSFDGSPVSAGAPAPSNTQVQAKTGASLSATSESEASWVASISPAPNPLFQMAKITEDSFALDFHTLSFFQAFCLALTAFDQ